MKRASRGERTWSAETRMSEIRGWNSRRGEAVAECKQHQFNYHQGGYGGGQARTTALQVLRLTVLWFNSLWKVARTRDSTAIACKQITIAAHGCNPSRLWAQHGWKSSLGSLLPLQSSMFSFQRQEEGFFMDAFYPLGFFLITSFTETRKDDARYLS